jgi:hypothetical protein
MRAYKFLNEEFGMKSLREQRLKISRLDDLNDPFELMPFSLSNQRHRIAVHQARLVTGARRGVLCFSTSWSDPVIWAHYSDKHRGLSLGFDVPNAKCQPVEYVSQRLPFPNPLSLEHVNRMLFTKYDSWKYEQELRIWAALEVQENGLYFREFGDDLSLCEVIVGARCSLSRREVKDALGSMAKRVRLIKGRPAFTRFEIVEDKIGLN